MALGVVAGRGFLEGEVGLVAESIPVAVVVVGNSFAEQEAVVHNEVVAQIAHKEVDNILVVVVVGNSFAEREAVVHTDHKVPVIGRLVGLVGRLEVEIVDLLPRVVASKRN